MLSTLFTGLAIGGLAKLTAPEAPKERALPAFDFDAETIKSLRERRDAQDPQMRQLLNQNYKTALTLSRGDIPDEVQRTIRSAMAESASTRGLSPAQFTRMNAQALGTTQMQMMGMGEQMLKTLNTIRDSEWAVASNSALARANRQFESFAASMQQRQLRYRTESAQHSSMWGGIATAALGLGGGGKKDAPGTGVPKPSYAGLSQPVPRRASQLPDTLKLRMFDEGF